MLSTPCLQQLSLLTMAKILNRWSCPSTDDCTQICDGMLFDYRKSKILPFAAKWLELGNIVLSEISQTKSDKCYMFRRVCESQCFKKHVEDWV